jgi:ribonuclease HI
MSRFRDEGVTQGISELFVFCDASTLPRRTGLGAVFRQGRGQLVRWRSAVLPPMTNNEAEYEAVIFGLRQALQFDVAPTQLIVFSDSRVVIDQMTGAIAVRHPALQARHTRACALARQLPAVAFAHIPRELNGLADALAEDAALNVFALSLARKPHAAVAFQVS